jgi:hypothetical protein
LPSKNLRAAQRDQRRHEQAPPRAVSEQVRLRDLAPDRHPPLELDQQRAIHCSDAFFVGSGQGQQAVALVALHCLQLCLRRLRQRARHVGLDGGRHQRPPLAPRSSLVVRLLRLGQGRGARQLAQHVLGQGGRRARVAC